MGLLPVPLAAAVGANSNQGGAPWWTLLLSGVIGALAGSLITFLSTYVATSRQLSRQERVVRREAYARWIATVTEAETLSRTAIRVRREVTELEAEVQRLKEADSPSEADLTWVENRLERVRIGFHRSIDDIRAFMRGSTLGFHDLALFAAPEVRSQGSRVARFADRLLMATLDGSQEEREAAENHLFDAIAEFTALARVDVGAPSDGMTVRRHAARLRKRRKQAGDPLADDLASSSSSEGATEKQMPAYEMPRPGAPS